MRKKCSQLHLKQLLHSLSCPPKFLHTQYLNICTLMHELIVKCWRWSNTSEVVGDGGLTVTLFSYGMYLPRNSIQIEILQTISNLRLMKVQEFKAKNTFTLNFPLWALRGSVKCRLQNDWGLLFVGLENSGNIVVTCSFARWKQ